MNEQYIKSRFFRKVMAYPEGAIVHHAYCEIFRVDICTCGLLHDLLSNDNIEKLYPEYYKERNKQEYITEWLMHNKKEIPEPRVLSEEEKEQCEKLLCKTFGDGYFDEEHK